MTQEEAEAAYDADIAPELLKIAALRSKSTISDGD